MPALANNSAFASHVIDNVLGLIPAAALLPVSKALNERPGWENQPNDISHELQELILKIESQDEMDEADVDLAFLSIAATLKVINKMLKLIDGLLPKDLVVAASVLGEGGGLTLTGHPARWFFVLSMFAIDELLIVLSYIHDLIEYKRKKLAA